MCSFVSSHFQTKLIQNISCNSQKTHFRAILGPFFSDFPSLDPHWDLGNYALSMKFHTKLPKGSNLWKNSFMIWFLGFESDLYVKKWKFTLFLLFFYRENNRKASKRFLWVPCTELRREIWHRVSWWHAKSTLKRASKPYSIFLKMSRTRCLCFWPYVTEGKRSTGTSDDVNHHEVWFHPWFVWWL